jgi:formylglycine-generating enzyme required for sulfatase activity
MASDETSPPIPEPDADEQGAARPEGEPVRRETLPLDDGDATIVDGPAVATAPETAAAEADDEIAPTHLWSGAGEEPDPATSAATERSRDLVESVPAPPPPSPLKPGDVFLGKYQIESTIGAGGMGSVVLARHIDLGAHYAIKVMHSSIPDTAAVDRFKREARASAMVDHPNIVRVFDCGEHDGHCYIVMEYLRGENLRQRLGRVGRFTVEETVRFAGVVCDVLEVMHATGIVHRDLKPDNIVFSSRGGDEAVKILDFGIVKLATASISGHLTRTGTVVGTPAYMSPEQCMAGDVDGRSDIYALGVILFQMLTGRIPFDSDNVLTMMYLHVNQEPPSAHDHDPSVPPEFAGVVRRMMAKEPAARYASATECAAALAEASGVAIPIRDGKSASAVRAVSGTGVGSTGDAIAPTADASPDYGRQQRTYPRRRWLGFALGGALSIAAVAAGVSYAPDLLRSGTSSSTPLPAGPLTTPTGVNPILTARFVEIAGGAVTIGANAGDCVDMDACEIGPDETPAHTVTLPAYWIARYEVTNQEYAEFVSATGHAPPTHWRGTFPRGTDALPVTNVSWNDAVAYAAWRSSRDGVAFRLPTEAEWEHAARGDDSRMFPWGDFWNATFVNSDQNKNEGSPLPVDQPPYTTTDVTPRGVAGLGGNVCEWTGSQFAVYPGSTYKPRARDLECKVIRGGSFNTKPNASRTTFRAWQPVDHTARDVGFRLAADASAPRAGS